MRKLAFVFAAAFGYELLCTAYVVAVNSADVLASSLLSGTIEAASLVIAVAVVSKLDWRAGGASVIGAMLGNAVAMLVAGR